ncbi:MAG: hypothetical protein KKG04_02335 [Candidatus Thermoplasmatota archaeon]|nr:hypothetical protein [Candidatus Thermoplasmatota archaeon]
MTTESIIHHVYHNNAEGDYRREVSITGPTTTVSLSSDDPKEKHNQVSKNSFRGVTDSLKGEPGVNIWIVP